MKSRWIAVGLLALLPSWVASVNAAPLTMNVIPAFAPNGPSSPSWAAYVTTSINALEIESPAVGSRATNPAAYEIVVDPVTLPDMMYTDFASWRGTAFPSPTFADYAPVFQSEKGNRIHFGLHVVSDGTVNFRLSDLAWELDSDDTTNYFDQAGAFTSSTYSPTRVGIDYGPNNAKGGGDDLIYDSGEPGSWAVDELIYVGVGDGFRVLAADTVGPNQADLDNTYRALYETCAGCTIELRGGYTLQNPLGGSPWTSEESVFIDLVPGFGGDFNHNFEIDSADKDMLTTEIVAGTNDVLFDLDLDGLVDFTDLEIMVYDIAYTYFGDANCDGEFNSDDLIEVFLVNKYETAIPAVWSEGDFNADGLFDSSDLILAFIDGGYNTGPRPAVAAVPEPAALGLGGLGLLSLAWFRRRRA